MTLRRIAPLIIIVLIALAAWAVVSLRDTGDAAPAGGPTRVELTPEASP